MCLTVPGRVVAITEPEPGLRFAQVDVRGLTRDTSLLYLPDARLGDYVIVQAGYAIRRLSEVEALEALEYSRQIDGLATPAAADPIPRSLPPPEPVV